MFKEYNNYDALGLAELVKTGEVSSLELIDECITRMEHVNEYLNGVITPMYELARDVAKKPVEGPFQGVPFLVKDLVASVKGVRFTSGCRFFKDNVADHDSELITRYRAAGLVFVGKSNTPEFGLKPMTEPVLHGPTQNPWRHGHTAGGSSGGSAAMVAARALPAAHGGDGGGSIRIPASCCGIFGMKPTRARTPAGPDHSEGWYGFSIEHALTLSVRDSAALLDATSAPVRYSPYAAPHQASPFLDEVSRDPEKLRIALCTDALMPANPEPAVVRAAEDAAKLCADLGHEVEEAKPVVDERQFAIDFSTLISVAVAVTIDNSAALLGRPATYQDFETHTWVTAMLGRTVDAVSLEKARQRLQAMSRTVADFFTNYDVLLTPTLGQSPPRHGALNLPGLLLKAEQLIAATGFGSVLKIPGLVEKIAAETFGFIPFTPLANVTGQPSMSVPLYWESGIPNGAMFTGRFGGEATLFRLAGQLERARPWNNRVPPINAAL